MATPQEKLANSLEVLETLQARGVVAVRSSELSRTHRERLLKNGFLQEVMKGWYISARPDERDGETTGWYASYWKFCAAYLRERFGEQYCLSPEQSLFLHAGQLAVPNQLLVKAQRGRNKPTELMHGTSLFDLRGDLPSPDYLSEFAGLKVYSLAASVVFSGPRLFAENSVEARAALGMVADASDVLAILLEGGHSTIAGRLAGAFRNIGRDKIADQIVSTMKGADYDVRERDPFEKPAPFTLSSREPSPYVMRMRLMWQEMREHIRPLFPPGSKGKVNIDAYMKRVDEVYMTDAYHSLSIEGYRVTRELIERVRSGNWNPDNIEKDREQRDALAARGYHDAFQAVKTSIEAVLQSGDAGTIADHDHARWYAALFGPSVTAGILRASELAGYRNGPVYIRNSQHPPPSPEALRDMMPVLFELLAEETEPSVRVVLGHFMFVYIHPYMDGNGRMGRFLMNVMLASGGYPWTVIPVDARNQYMAALESASVEGNIQPFTAFLAGLVEDNIAGKPGPKVPEDK